MKRRRIAEFSQRDRVPAGALRDGDRFVWRGRVHTFDVNVTTDIVQPHTRVIVSRASGIAHRTQSERR